MVKWMLVRMFQEASERNRRNILDMVGAAPADSMLDLGCDRGDWTMRLAERAKAREVHGIEINEQAAIAAREKGIQVSVDNLMNRLPYNEGTFDLVHANQVIEHVPDIDHFAREAVRVLKPGLLAAGLRICMTFNSSADPLGKYVFINFFVFVIMVWMLSLALWSASEVEVPQGAGHLRNALMLSAASNIIPQFDMFLMHHTQKESNFIDFTRASLFGRAIFSATSILAQWMLPGQIRAGFTVSIETLTKFLAGAFSLSAILSLCSTFIAQVILNWEVIPPPFLVFLASAQFSVLAMMFILVQGYVARHQLRAAGVLLGLLLFEGLLQFYFKFTLEQFLLGALAIQIMGTWAVVRGQRKFHA